MLMEKKLEKLLSEAFPNAKIEIINESSFHSGHSGDDGSGQTHFKVVIASSELKTLGRVRAHREVMGVINSCFDEGLHAFGLTILES